MDEAVKVDLGTSSIIFEEYLSTTVTLCPVPRRGAAMIDRRAAHLLLSAVCWSNAIGQPLLPRGCVACAFPN